MRFLAAFFLAAGAFAADLSGIWVGQVPTRNGEFLDIAFQLRQTGTTLSGKLYGDYRSDRIVEGTVEGDQVRFVVLVAEQAGNEINETRTVFTGTLKNGELELTRERLASTRAGAASGAHIRENNKTAIKLKKLL